MPRDLADVLHYFMPELTPQEQSAAQDRRTSATDEALLRPRSSSPAIAAVPIGEHDLVRAAFTWNLVIEVARLGGRATLLSPVEAEPGRLFPMPGAGPGGAELRFSEATNLAELQRAARRLAVKRATQGRSAGMIFVRVPPRWLREVGTGPASGLLDWLLLFTTTHQLDLADTVETAKLVLRANPKARVGIAMHGARERSEADRAFASMARSAEQDLGGSVDCYGTLLDDLDIYRSIVARNAIGLCFPESPTARTLRDVARRMLERAPQVAIA